MRTVHIHVSDIVFLGRRRSDAPHWFLITSENLRGFGIGRAGICSTPSHFPNTRYQAWFLVELYELGHDDLKVNR